MLVWDRKKKLRHDVERVYPHRERTHANGSGNLAFDSWDQRSECRDGEKGWGKEGSRAAVGSSTSVRVLRFLYMSLGHSFWQI